MKHPDPRIESALARLASPALQTIDLSLDRITALLAALGNPQNRLPPVVHVAGTNGKGSLLAYLAAMLGAAGFKAHRYISPHLVRFNERILLQGEEIDDERLLDLLTRIEARLPDHPVTFFEATTAAAFLAFSETQADIVLLETGLGGRLDATNLVRAPILTAITPVSFDHMEYLGNTLAAIAGEKAGIIKPGVPCVVGPQIPEAMNVIKHTAAAREAPLYRFGGDWQAEPLPQGFLYRSSKGEMELPMPGLAGAHQLFNAATAVACMERLPAFPATQRQLAQGIKSVKWPARLQRLITGNLVDLLPQGCELWLDGGHNPDAGRALAQWAAAQNKPIHLICGMLKNKDTLHFLSSLKPCVRSVTPMTIDGESLSRNSHAISEVAKQLNLPVIEASSSNSAKSAIEAIVKKAESPFILLICGSLYLAGNILWQNNQRF